MEIKTTERLAADQRNEESKLAAERIRAIASWYSYHPRTASPREWEAVLPQES